MTFFCTVTDLRCRPFCLFTNLTGVFPLQWLLSSGSAGFSSWVYLCGNCLNYVCFLVFGFFKPFPPHLCASSRGFFRLFFHLHGMCKSFLSWLFFFFSSVFACHISGLGRHEPTDLHSEAKRGLQIKSQLPLSAQTCEPPDV